jgi:hypothetical protein
MPLSAPRALEHALADLIERRKNKILLTADREMLDRMIDGLEAEITLRKRRVMSQFSMLRALAS